jgi:hypothetical protein
MAKTEQKKDEQEKDVRVKARETLAAHSEKWSAFRSTGGEVVDAYFNDGFTYLEKVINNDSKPTDWVKDGVSILIGYCGAGRKLYQATYDLLASKD